MPGMKRKRGPEDGPNGHAKSVKARGADNDADESISDDGDMDATNNGHDDDAWGGGLDGTEEEEEDIEEDEGEASEEGDGDEDPPLDTSQTINGHGAESRASNGVNGTVNHRQAPTTQEMRLIKEASELYKSNSFKLKIDAFLPTLRPSEYKKAALTSFLHTVRAHLLALPDIPPSHPLAVANHPSLHSTIIPYPTPRPLENVNWKVAFEKPADVHVIGSWPTGMSVSLSKGKREWGVDLGVVMPASLFEKKDYLNARFFHKRAFYLAVLAGSLSDPESNFGVEVAFECPSGDERRTTIVLRARKDGSSAAQLSSSFAVHIHLLLPRGSDFPFPLPQLSPSHASIRTTTEDATPPATPIYNSLILSHSLPLSLLVTIHQFTQDIPGYRDAVALARAWAARRGFNGGSGRKQKDDSLVNERVVLGWESRGVWWACLVGGCVQGWEGVGSKARLGRGMSSYQLFRGVIDFLATHDFEKQPIFMKTKDGLKYPMQEYKMYHEAVFVDSSSLSNLLLGMPLSSLTLLRHEASASLKMLNEDSEDAFDALFLRDLSQPHIRFDAVIRVDVSSAVPLANLSALQLHHSSHTNALLHSMASVVRRALSSRAEAVAVLQSTHPEWTPTDARPEPAETVEIGIIFNPSQFFRLVDHGPPADDAEGTAAYRDFWGDKSELRRFKDGSILESVVWEADGLQDRANIPSRMVSYILGRHFGIVEDRITLYQPLFDPVLQLPASIVDAVAGISSHDLGFKHIQSAYDRLVKELKAIEDLPLTVQSVSASSEGLRYTSPYPAMPLDAEHFASLPDCAKYIEAHDIILEFESSAKWPDDLAAAQKVKLAFFEEVAQRIRERMPDVQAAVALDAFAMDIEDNCSLEIVMPNGIAFRARIHHNRERTLLERMLADTKTEISERRRAEQALQLYRNRFHERSMHHAALSNLQHVFPAYSQTVRLMKRWFNAHLLSPHVPPELIELVCANVFINPGSFNPPASLFTGFARVIHLLSMWKWRDEPLVVPLYTAKDAEAGRRVVFPKDKRNDALTAFASLRTADPGLSSSAWFIATELDLAGTAWGKAAPETIVCRRITQLAKTCYQYLASAAAANTLQVQTMFKPPLEDYDFILHLIPSMLPRYYQNTHADQSVWLGRMKYKNLPLAQQTAYGPEVRVDFDPPSLLYRDLQRMYRDTCVLFYDALGGDVIAGVWDPSILNPAQFKVLLGFSTGPYTEGQDPKKRTVVLNKAGILSEMARIGAGLIRSISSK